MTNKEFLIKNNLEIGNRKIKFNELPGDLIVHKYLGILTSLVVNGTIIHRTAKPSTKLFETRATITPEGDYLLMFPEGNHYNNSPEKVNRMISYRSSNKGQSWEGPTEIFDIDYSQHGFIPLILKGSKRIYAFGTQPIKPLFTEKARTNGQHENAPIGYRYSDDDGHTWSEVRIIRPENDPEFRGMSVMRMCETDAGTWLLGSHEGDWSYNPLMTRQYILRSEDKGETWQVVPDKRHGGWYARGFNRMDEGRPINLGDGKILLMTRTPEGHLWQLRSEDDGRTWSQPEPTSLIHPDAPPMLFHLSDGETLIAFHHNRYHDFNYTGLDGNKEDVMKDRSEIWFSLSSDEGRTWSEPKFVFVNALKPNLDSPFRNYQCSYMDMILDNGIINLFVPHRWQQVLHLKFHEKDLYKFPNQDELQGFAH